MMSPSCPAPAVSVPDLSVPDVPVDGRDLRRLAGELAMPSERATVALVRLDERLGRSDPQIAEGVRARAHLLEAQALVQLCGETVSLEALILHDVEMDACAPDAGTVKAARFLAQRRALASRRPDCVLAAAAIRRLVGGAEQGVAPAPAGSAGGANAQELAAGGAGQAEPWSGASAVELGEPDPALADPFAADSLADNPLHQGLADGDIESLDLPAIDRLLAGTRAALAGPFRAAGSPGVPLRGPAQAAEGRLRQYCRALDAAREAPAVLASALALDAWLRLEPGGRGGAAGWALAATVLRQRDLCHHHLPALALGYRKGRFRWSPHLGAVQRLEGLLAAIAASARLAQADLERLILARALMMRRCEGKRAGSRLHDLVGLFLTLPLVTTQVAAQHLKVTPQAIEAMLKELGPALPRELTGRKRYRAWGILPGAS